MPAARDPDPFDELCARICNAQNFLIHGVAYAGTY